MSQSYFKSKWQCNFCLFFLKERNNTSAYLIYENIAPADSVHSLFTQGLLTPRRFMRLYIQFLYALRYANEKYKFTHYDCHTENVLVRKIDKPAVIRYPFDNGVVYMEVDEVITFIDYGFSYVEFDNKKYGIHKDFRNFSIYNDRPFILYDVFKFIAGCVNNMPASFPWNLKTTVMSTIAPDFFNNTTAYHGKFNSAVYNDQTKNWNINNYINECLSYMNDNGYDSGILVDDNNKSNLLYCKKELGNCASVLNGFLNVDINPMNAVPVPTDIYELNLITRSFKLDDSNELAKYTKILDTLISNYPNSLYNSLSVKSIKESNMYFNIFKSFNIIKFPTMDNIRNNFDYTDFINYMNAVYKLNWLFQNILNLLNTLKSKYANFPVNDELDDYYKKNINYVNENKRRYFYYNKKIVEDKDNIANNYGKGTAEYFKFRKVYNAILH